MRLIHTSDIHIDSPLTARLTEEKVRERRRELLHGFGDLVKEAKRLSASGIIIAGDLFDSSKISKRALRTALDVMESSPELAFFYLSGNHEGAALLESGEAMPKNLYIFGDEWTYFESDEVIIAGRGRCEGDMFDTLKLPPDKKNIVVLHGELRDHSAAPDVIGKKDALGRGIDYLALGHYHSYSEEQLDRRTRAVYSGTPEGRGFDEVGEKGFVLLEVGSAGITHSFRPFAKRRLHIIEVDITEAERSSEIEERCRVALGGIPSGDLVRIELVGKHTPGFSPDINAITRAFLGKFYYVEAKDSTKMLIDPDAYKNDKSLKGEFIRLVSADPSLSGDEKEKIIKTGLYALMGEEYFGG